MRLSIDPKVDLAFKRAFGIEDNALLLIALLQAIVQPVRAITGLEILPGHSRKDAPAEKQAVGDIRARDQGGRQFHLEMQWQVPWFFLKRVLFYWSKFHPEQLRVGEDYQTLRPTISVCFLNQVLFPEVADHHLVFRLLEAKHGLLFDDDLEIHLIEVPKFRKSVEDVSSALDRWLYFFRHGAELDLDHLPATMDAPEIRRAMEVLTVFTQDEYERAAYEARLKDQRDQSSLLREVREAREAREALAASEKAREQAERGREQAERGRERGILIGKIHLCQELLKQPPTPEAELVALTPEALAALLAQLRKQALPNGG